MTYAPTADVFLYSANPDANYEADWIEVGKTYNKIAVIKSRILISFDVSDLAGETVDAASTLYFYCHYDTASITDTLQGYRCKRAWVENQATWNSFSTGNAWQTAGGEGADDVDYSIGPASGNFATAVNTWATMTGVGLAAIIQDAIDNWGGALSLWIFASGDNTPNENNKNAYRASEYATEAQRPYLDVVLAGGAAVRRRPIQVI